MILVKFIHKTITVYIYLIFEFFSLIIYFVLFIKINVFEFLPLFFIHVKFSFIEYFFDLQGVFMTPKKVQPTFTVAQGEQVPQVRKLLT